MKKSLFALAALSAFATAAQAQSSVTLYGNLDATEAYQSAGIGKSYALTGSANTTSLWGMTGSEDMGGGMKMGFDLKSEINMATGATGSGTNVTPANSLVATTLPTATSSPTNTGATANLFNRGANIFISSASLGEVKVGRMDDIEWAMSGGFSTSGSNSFGSNQAHAQIGNIANTGLGVCGSAAAPTAGIAGNGICSTMGYVTNNANTYQGTADAFMAGIQYTTPVFSGFSAKVQTGVGANSATAPMGTGNVQGFGMFYTGLGGNLNLAFGQSNRFDDVGQLGLKITTLGAKYKVIPSTTLIGTWTQTGLSNSTAAGGVMGVSGANAGNTMYSFGVNHQVTPSIDVNLAYTNVTGDTSATATSAANGSINGSANSVNMLGLTGRYAFSKRTQMYAGIGQANNSGAYFMSPIYGGVTMGGITTGTGANIAAAMLGLRHSF